MSHWNGFPDFVQLRDAGMRFVFSKASQGLSFIDDTFHRHTREARQAGLLVGAYHFFDYRKGGKKQAQHYLATLRGTTGLGSLLPLVVDVETLSTLGTPNKTLARQRLHALMDELYRQTGRYPMIYTSQSMWRRVVGEPRSFGQYPLWVACWKCDTIHLPRGWTDWLFWQVGQFRFAGGLKLDGNVFSASMSKLHLHRERTVKVDRGAVYALRRAVQADLRGLDGKDVRVAIGDGSFGAWEPFHKEFGLNLAGSQGAQEVRLQLRSFRNVNSPVFRDGIILDSVPPAVAGPIVGMRLDGRVPPSGDRVPASATMNASDATSGLAASDIKAACDGTKPARRKAGPAGTAELAIELDRAGCSLTASASDVAGHRTTKRLDPRILLRDVRAGSAQVTLRGQWKTLRQKGAVNRTLARAAAPGAVAQLTFQGRQFAVVVRRGPSGGSLKVILDGKHVDTIDLYAPEGDARRIAYVRSVGKGSHTLRLRTAPATSAQSNGSFVWLDAILLLERRR